MRHAIPASLLALALGGGVLAAWGCGETDPAPASGSRRPPGAEGPATTSTEERVYAINAIWLGDTDRSGNTTENAWKSFGYDLDGLQTNASDLSKVCQRADGADPTVHQDGEQGTDNVFGKEVVHLLENVVGSPSRTLTASMVAGDFTILLKTTGLTDDPAQTNTSLAGGVVVGGKFSDAGAPTFTTADDWPYVAASEVPLTNAYVNKGVYVNGGKDTIKLSLIIGGQTLSLTLHNAIVSFKHNGASLDDGTIAGVADTEEFVAGVAAIAGRFDKTFCSGVALELIKSTIRNSSDSLLDGTQDPSRPCNALSVGIGFTAKQVAIPTREALAPPQSPSLCEGAGGSDAGETADAGDDANDAGADADAA